MTKPASIPTWAIDANYPLDAEVEAGTPTKVALSTGQAGHGWRPNQVPTAQEMNTQLNLLGQWTSWLDGLVDVGGTYTAEQGGSIILSGDELDLWATSNVHLVGDRVTNAGKRYQCTIAGSSTAVGPGPNTTAADIVDGTVHWKFIGRGNGGGLVYTTTREMITIDPTAYRDMSGGAGLNADGYVSMGNGLMWVPVHLPAGRRLRFISPTYFGDGVTDLVMTLQENLGNAVPNVIDSATVINPSAGWATGLLDIDVNSGAGYLMHTGNSYRLLFSTNGTGAKVGPVRIQYDFPPPA